MADLPPNIQPPASPFPPVPPALPQDEAPAAEVAALSPFAVLQKKGTAPLQVPPVPAAPSFVAPVAPSPSVQTPAQPAPSAPGQAASSLPPLPPSPSVAPPVAPMPPVLPPIMPPQPASMTPPPPLRPQPVASPVPSAAPRTSSGSPLDDDLSLGSDTNHFVLPPLGQVPPAPAAQPPLPAPASPAAQPLRPAAPGATPPASQVLPQMPAAPTVFPAAPAVPMAGPLASSVPAAPLGVVPPSPLMPVEAEGGRVTGKRSGLFIAAGGGLLAVILLAGGLYALAYNGIRVPFLYGIASGLQPAALDASVAAAVKLDAASSYKYSGSIDLALESGGTSPDISNASIPVFKLASSIPKGQVTEGETVVSRFDISANSNTAVPVITRSSKASMLAFFPAGNETDTVIVKSDQVDQTLLAPVVKPFAAETLVKAVKAEKAYQKQEYSGKSVAAYSVDYDCAVLQAKLPADMSIESCSGTVAYLWESGDGRGGLPAQASVKAMLTYKEKKYAYTSVLQYAGWNESLGSGSDEGDLALIADADASALGAPISAQEMVSRLGIGFTQLPHDQLLDASIGTVSEFPIVPSGESSSVPVSPLIGSAPSPVQPATAEGKSRDLQRKKDLADLKKALDEYWKDNGSYPASSSAGEQAGASEALYSALVGEYLTKMPLDPLKGTYYYYYKSEGGSSFQLRAVLEDMSDTSAISGSTYAFYEVTN